MDTVTIQIGNSDDKLTQREWAAFVRELRSLVETHCVRVHFSGGSGFDAGWQNACFVAEIEDHCKEALVEWLVVLRKKYKQDSVAVTFGETRFV